MQSYLALLSAAFILVFWTCYGVECNDNLQIAYQWKQMDFEFQSNQQRQQAIENGTFISANVIPMGLEVYKNRLFINLARWKHGVPASLAYIDLNGKAARK